MSTRSGIGYDSHRFEEGRKFMLGGVEIEYERGLAGHSDADVALPVLIALLDVLQVADALFDGGADAFDERLLRPVLCRQEGGQE